VGGLLTKLLVPALLLVCGPLLAEEGAAKVEASRFLVVVGYNGTDSGERPQLQFADDDATRFFLQALPSAKQGWLLTSMDSRSARAFPDLAEVARPPTVDELARVLGEVAWAIRGEKRSGHGTELVFYFAGHGDVGPNGEGFLVLGDRAFTRSDLETHVIGASEADLNHILIDACASYYMVPRGDQTSGKIPLTPELMNVLKPHPNLSAAARAKTGILVSTSDAAEVHENGAIGGGVFSYLLRSAIAGAGDASGDGKVEYGEAAAFLASASRHIEDPRAQLKVFARPPEIARHAPLIDLSAAGYRHYLSLGPQDAHHVRILDARGTPLLEMNRSPESSTYLALVGNPYYIVQSRDKEAVLVPRRAGAYAFSALQFQIQAENQRRGMARGPPLFKEPLSPDFVHGFLATREFPPPATGDPFSVPYAVGHEAPVRFPHRLVASGFFALSGIGLVTTVVGTAMNWMAYQALADDLATTGTLSPERVLEVEAWRTVAIAGMASGAVFAAVGGVFFFLGSPEEGP
jgi:hypothetical protein